MTKQLWLYLNVIFIAAAQAFSATLSTGATLADWEPIVYDVPSQNIISLTKENSDPLLLTSSQSIISSSECKTLIDYCQSKLHVDSQSGMLTTSCDINPELFEQDLIERKKGAIILQNVQQMLLATLGLNEWEAVMPRYIYYTDEDCSIDETVTLLPDGLHVDSNNGKFFRHWTVLLYLTSNYHSGATIFPLIGNNHIDDVQVSDMKNAFNAAENLIASGVYHTRMENMTHEQKVLAEKMENYAMSSMIHDNGSTRVMPREGNVCIFSGIRHDGFPHPASFHGGESLFKRQITSRDEKEKHVLTFFYEVPVGTFSSRIELGMRVKEREERFKSIHGM
jgi:hypothetical protein